MKAILAVLLSAALVGVMLGAVIEFGPGKQHATVCDAISAAKEGDTISGVVGPCDLSPNASLKFPPAPQPTNTYTVLPDSLVMGIGGTVTIASAMPVFDGSSIVTMDGTALATTLVSASSVTAAIPGRRFWHGPKRLAVAGAVIDGKFRLDEFRPFGTKNVLWDFEDGGKNRDTAGTGHHAGAIIGRAQYHGIALTGNSLTTGIVADDPGHGLALRSDIIESTDGQTRWWMLQCCGRPFNWTYVAEAVGMNRFVYDFKAPATYNKESGGNVGTYYRDPDYPITDTQPESHNGHYYARTTFTNPGAWQAIAQPFLFYNQRQSGGCCASVQVQGTSPTLPVAHRRGVIPEDISIEWKRGGKTFTVSPFDHLTRFYVDHTDQYKTGMTGQYMWYDNIGFASVDDGVSISANWAIRDAAPDTLVEFPFSVTNRRPTPLSVYMVTQYQSSQDYYTGYLTAATEGVFENGVKVDATPSAQVPMSRPFAPGETRYFTMRGRSYKTLGELRTAYVSIFEAGVPTAESSQSIYTYSAGAYRPVPIRNDGVYRSFMFHMNTPRVLLAVTPAAPQKASVVQVGSDTWIHWDDAPEAQTGTLAWYELERDGAQYRTVSAASPGFIDRGVTGKSYRVRAISTTGGASEWSAAPNGR